MIGEGVRRMARGEISKVAMVVGLSATAFALLLAFLWYAMPNLQAELLAIARNQGKHPPEIPFMLFSLGGALFAFSGALFGGDRLASIARPLLILGKQPLQAFVFHIFVIFVFYRYLLDYWRSVSYPHALSLTAFLFVLTVAWLRILRWVQEKS